MNSGSWWYVVTCGGSGTKGRQSTRELTCTSGLSTPSAPRHEESLPTARTRSAEIEWPITYLWGKRPPSSVNLAEMLCEP